MKFFDFLQKKKPVYVENKGQSVVPPQQVEGTEPPEIKNTPILTVDKWDSRPSGTISIDAVNVVGVTFNNDDGVSRQKILSHMKKYEEVYLEPESENPHDNKAIAVVGAMGKFGHIQKEIAPVFHQFLNAGFSSRVKFFGPLSSDDLKILGAKLYVQFFPPENCRIFKLKIVGITGKTYSGDSRKDIAECLITGNRIYFDGDVKDNGEPVVEVSNQSLEQFGKLGKKDAEIIHPLTGSEYGQYGAVLENGDEGIYVAGWFWDKTEKEREQENTIRVTIG